MQTNILLVVVCALCIRVGTSRLVMRNASHEAPYAATVVEFAPKSSNPLQNLLDYEFFIKEASSKGSQIIVFPEYGLTTTQVSEDRDAARAVSYIVPDPTLLLVPCDVYNTSQEYQVVKELSCFARENNMYLVTNMLEQEACVDCAPDNVLLFNTNVAFNRLGQVIARYRKYNVYFEFALNQTTTPEISYFDADFGPRFGLMTCFDIMFEEPAVTLVKQYGVTDMIFPTAWIHELPFLTAVQTQSLWSYAMNVNLLGSGFSDPITGKGGTGIYDNSTGVVIHATPWEPSRLLLHGNLNEPETFSPIVRNQKNKVNPPYYYHENLTNYVTHLIDLTANNYRYDLCIEGLCCKIDISATIFDTTVLRIIAFNEERTFGGYYTNCKVQTCGIVRCLNAGDPVTNCGLVMTGIAQKFTLHYLKISANFSNNAIIGPSIVNGDFGILTGDKIIFNKVDGDYTSDFSLELTQPIMENILTFALWGRVFPKSSQETPKNGISTFAYIVGGILIAAVLTGACIALLYRKKSKKNRININS